MSATTLIDLVPPVAGQPASTPSGLTPRQRMMPVRPRGGRSRFLAHLLASVLVAAGASGCGASLAQVTQPGTSRLELRLVALNEADGFKVQTWDGKATMVVDKHAALTDRDIEKVRLSKLPDGSPSIEIQFDQTASLALEDLTLKNIGRRLCILVNGKAVIAPTIKERVVGGSVTVTGFNLAETTAIYDRIKK